VKKITGICLLFASLAMGATHKLPQNVRFQACTVYVKADTTVYSKKLYFGASAWRMGKVAIFDTNIVTQDTLNIGAGVKIRQRICFPVGNTFGYDSVQDTMCDVCGDSTKSAFLNQPVLSGDSVICNEIDTSEMGQWYLGRRGDTLWVTNGYFVMVPDPSPATDFEVTGTATFGSTVKRVIIMIWDFLGYPVNERR
jgi:hypothetical protein